MRPQIQRGHGHDQDRPSVATAEIRALRFPDGDAGGTRIAESSETFFEMTALPISGLRGNATGRTVTGADQRTTSQFNPTCVNAAPSSFRLLFQRQASARPDSVILDSVSGVFLTSKFALRPLLVCGMAALRLCLMEPPCGLGDGAGQGRLILVSWRDAGFRHSSEGQCPSRGQELHRPPDNNLAALGARGAVRAIVHIYVGRRRHKEECSPGSIGRRNALSTDGKI